MDYFDLAVDRQGEVANAFRGTTTRSGWRTRISTAPRPGSWPDARCMPGWPRCSLSHIPPASWESSPSREGSMECRAFTLVPGEAS
jgi:hypothetical protein